MPVTASIPGRRLDQLAPDDLRRYQAYLFKERKLAIGTVGLHVAVLRFFSVRVLKRRALKEELPTQKRHPRLPTILSPDEVRRLIAGAKNLYHRTMLLTLYGRDTCDNANDYSGVIDSLNRRSFSQQRRRRPFRRAAQQQRIAQGRALNNLNPRFARTARSARGSKELES